MITEILLGWRARSGGTGERKDGELEYEKNDGQPGAFIRSYLWVIRSIQLWPKSSRSVGVTNGNAMLVAAAVVRWGDHVSKINSARITRYSPNTGSPPVSLVTLTRYYPRLPSAKLGEIVTRHWAYGEAHHRIRQRLRWPRLLNIDSSNFYHSYIARIIKLVSINP